MGRFPSRGSWLAAALLAFLPALTGCAQVAVLEVRAQRAYGNEDPDPAVVMDRLDDVKAVLAQVDELLRATPYTPGDTWTHELALDDDRADHLRAAILKERPYDSGDFEVPIVKLYRRHLAQVLDRARSSRSAKPAFPTILDALTELTPSAAPLRAQWDLFEKARAVQIDRAQKVAKITAELLKKRVPMMPAARDPEKLAAAKRDLESARQIAGEEKRKLLSHIATLAILGRGGVLLKNNRTIAEEALAAVSVAERVDLEVIALLPVVVSQTRRLDILGDRDLFRALGESKATDLSLLPLRAKALQDEAEGELSVMQETSLALTGITGTRLDKTAGYALRDSVVDQVAGVSLDSTHAVVRLDGQALFYHQIGAASEAASSTDSTTDFTGRRHRLDYDVSPIMMVGAKLIATFDFLHRKNAASLNAGFSTNRIWSQNGTIDNGGSLPDLLGVKGFASDLLNIGADLIGIQTRLRLAQFTAGEVREIGVDPKTGADTGVLRKAPLSLRFRQVDIGYDVSWLMQDIADRYWIEELLVGFRYMGYKLPRILYELENTTPTAETSHFAFLRESPPQNVTSDYYMGGFQARFGQGDARRLSLFGDLGVFGGSGPMAYYFLRDPDGKDVPDNRLVVASPVLVVNGSAGLGARVRLTPKKTGRFRVLIEARYGAEMLYQTIISELLETKNAKGDTVITTNKRIDFGGFDIFHGPRVQVVGVF
ncbi:MAG: hypothetical protein U0359_16615 [Byssovorax sp.]